MSQIDDTAQSHAMRPSVVQLLLRDKASLYEAYIPLFAHGGLFIPTDRDYRLGDVIYVLVTLPEEMYRHPIAGRIAWVTPANAPAHRTQGVGMVLPDDEKGEAVRKKIEELLHTHLPIGKPTQTV
ncbi:PilZ domain-containing protein [Candidatus Symbiobacter mobilis]|uniref:Type IV pilus assembly protein PilZ n=1 Tax=Candidatus Symbiobacter mobilis CR TaxID=946483 RepID=U5N5Y1_9BURK|nr:PilZ domain-containing protein [Candidatus Symbiobacter mobilis]AGX86772.1 type IV pilus assembly protein PilZ [Candidatus Symbiobacter mobilis CR]